MFNRIPADAYTLRISSRTNSMEDCHLFEFGSLNTKVSFFIASYQGQIAILLSQGYSMLLHLSLMFLTNMMMVTLSPLKRPLS